MNGYRTEPASLDQYLDDVQNETIKSDQAVQRSFCWGNEPMNNLIASAVSQTVYIPNLILSEETKENGIKVMYIVDGGHRTETLRRFRYCGYKTTSTIRDPFVKYSRKQVDKDGEYVRDENGDIVWEIAEFDLRKKTYDDLPPELKRQFNKCPLGMTIYQDCTSEDTSRLVNLYNNHVAMNVSQKSLTYIGKFANYIKKIKDTNRFLIDGTDLTESEKNKGMWERVISECVMAVFHFDKWKSDPKKMCDYLNDNSSLDEYKAIELYFDRLIPYSDKLDYPEIAALFKTKSLAVWMMVFNEFSKMNIDDAYFGEFLEKFVASMSEILVNNVTWSDLDIDKHTKDKTVMEHKFNHITYLMKKFMNEHVGIETENTYVEEESTQDNTEVVESTLDFVKENVSDDIDSEDVEIFKSMVDDCVRIDTPVYEKCQTALIALMGFACREDKDKDFEEWVQMYSNTNTEFSNSQKINYTYMKRDFDRFMSVKGGAA